MAGIPTRITPLVRSIIRAPLTGATTTTRQTPNLAAATMSLLFWP
jgi:hypothetical protein